MMLRGINTNKLYSQQKSCEYHYYQYTKLNCTNLFHKERLFNMKSCCGLQFHLQPALCSLAKEKERFTEGSILQNMYFFAIAYFSLELDNAQKSVGPTKASVRCITLGSHNNWKVLILLLGVSCSCRSILLLIS